MKGKVYALIPARGGSKGIPFKNIVLLVGKPLIQYSIEAALSVLNIAQVWVSSDSDDILAVAEKVGAKILKRPADISTDLATSDAVVEHFCDQLKLNPNDIIILLQPTSPLRNSNDIRLALDAYKDAGCLISVRPTQECPQKTFTLHPSGKLEPLCGENDAFMPRQSLPQTYLPNGAIYIFSVLDFMKTKKIPRSPLYPYLMSVENSMDIDTKKDLKLAERILKGEINET